MVYWSEVLPTREAAANFRIFFGLDTIFELAALLITALIFIYAYKIYTISKNVRYRNFSIAFFLIALSFLFKIFTNIEIYLPIIKEQTLGFIAVKYETVEPSNILRIVGLALHRLFMLSGLFWLYQTMSKCRSNRHAVIIIYFILMTVLFATAQYFVFYISTTLFLLLIFLSAYGNHLAKKTDLTKYVAAAFFILFLSQIIFIFIFKSTYLYIIAESVQILGFLLLLLMYLKISWKKEK